MNMADNVQNKSFLKPWVTILQYVKCISSADVWCCCGFVLSYIRFEINEDYHDITYLGIIDLFVQSTVQSA